MAQHKYSAGQNVRFTPDRNTDATARGAYTIVKTLPEAGGVLQYRVKGKINGQERGSRRPARAVSDVRTHPYAAAV